MLEKKIKGLKVEALKRVLSIHHLYTYHNLQCTSPPPPHPQAFQAPSHEKTQGDDQDIDPTS